jgi:hypothetical protein
MTGSDTTDGIDSLTDPATLRNRAGVPVETTEHVLDDEEFADAADWTSTVVVGVADDRGVLLMNDGHHGWTLPFTDAGGDDWLATARRKFSELVGVPVAIEDVEFARCRDARLEGGDDSRQIWGVLVTATTTGDPIPDDPESTDDGIDLRWADAPPTDASDPVAADIERVLATRDQ